MRMRNSATSAKVPIFPVLDISEHSNYFLFQAVTGRAMKRGKTYSVSTEFHSKKNRNLTNTSKNWKKQRKETTERLEKNLTCSPLTKVPAPDLFSGTQKEQR